MVVDYKTKKMKTKMLTVIWVTCLSCNTIAVWLVCSQHALYIFSGELGQRAFIQGLLFDFMPPVLPFPPSFLDRSTQQIVNDSRR